MSLSVQYADFCSKKSVAPRTFSKGKKVIINEPEEMLVGHGHSTMGTILDLCIHTSVVPRRWCVP